MAGTGNRSVKKQPIFRKILVPMMVLLILEILLLVGSVFGRGLISELNKNAKTIVDEKVTGRKNYLENEMINNWMKLEYTSEIINDKAMQLSQEGKIDIATLDDGSFSGEPLLGEVTEDLISMMRTNKVTGVFLILNTGDTSHAMTEDSYENKPGIYLRNVNPMSQVSYRNQDLLFERGPISVVRQTGIAMDSSWTPQFEFADKGLPYYDFFYRPYQIAYENPGKYKVMDMGYWSGSHELIGEKRDCISFSIPLVLDDGTVYGVMGVDITLDYLRTLLPYTEIGNQDTSAYLLGIQGKNGELESIVMNGPILEVKKARVKDFIEGDDYYTHTEPLNLYNSNAPFSEEQWTLTGILPMNSVVKFARTIEITLLIAIIITLFMGIVGTLVISVKLTTPIARLSREIERKNPGEMITLEATGIREIDNMAESIEKMSNDAIESGRKFTQIIEMASVRLAGFEIDWKENTIFITDHFFELFGSPELDGQKVDALTFGKQMKNFDKFYIEKEQLSNSYIYKIPDGRRFRFVRLRFAESVSNCYGMAEDVTQSLIEKNLLKHERDHDPLTNLYNRRAFGRLIRELFEEHSDQIGLGALLMMDLDNLKYVNDTFGHDYGDRYISRAAAVLKETLPEAHSLAARISGDEFNVFFYGYETEEELRDDIRELRKGFDMSGVELPGERFQKIRLSGGVAWYPEDAQSLEILQRYADYAMYMVKNSVKGEICDFDIQRYQSEQFIRQNRASLTELIEKRAVRYAFQPIVDTKTGGIFAYEALMRPAMQNFRSALDILDVARAEKKLNQIEELTWFKAADDFINQIKRGTIGEHELLFINSIPNQRMSEEKEESFIDTYKEYINRFVMELTEEEQMQNDIWQCKKKCLDKAGIRVALDDYGTGYNSEKVLIHVSPDYIKIDIALIKDIDRNPDKQAMVEYIVNYAHQRRKKIIAEGVENAAETEQIIRLGVDFIQGYYMAKPDFNPPSVSKEALGVIQRVNKEMEE